MEVGNKVSVWWETFDKDENGGNLATVLEVMPYEGTLDFVKCVVKVTAPNTKRGYLEMSVVD